MIGCRGGGRLVRLVQEAAAEHEEEDGEAVGRDSVDIHGIAAEGVRSIARMRVQRFDDARHQVRAGDRFVAEASYVSTLIVEAGYGTAVRALTAIPNA